MIYSSGGHNAPILMRNDGALELLEKGGLPLGAFDFGTYEEGTFLSDVGDLLFLYTDGLDRDQGHQPAKKSTARTDSTDCCSSQRRRRCVRCFPVR